MDKRLNELNRQWVADNKNLDVANAYGVALVRSGVFDLDFLRFLVRHKDRFYDEDYDFIEQAIAKINNAYTNTPTPYADAYFRMAEDTTLIDLEELLRHGLDTGKQRDLFRNFLNILSCGQKDSTIKKLAEILRLFPSYYDPYYYTLQAIVNWKLPSSIPYLIEIFETAPIYSPPMYSHLRGSYNISPHVNVISALGRFCDQKTAVTYLGRIINGEMPTAWIQQNAGPNRHEYSRELADEAFARGGMDAYNEFELEEGRREDIGTEDITRLRVKAIVNACPAHIPILKRIIESHESNELRWNAIIFLRALSEDLDDAIQYLSSLEIFLDHGGQLQDALLVSTDPENIGYAGQSFLDIAPESPWDQYREEEQDIEDYDY